MYQHLVEPPGHIAHAPWHQSLVCCVVYNRSFTSQHFTLDTTSTRLLYFTLVTPCGAVSMVNTPPSSCTPMRQRVVGGLLFEYDFR